MQRVAVEEAGVGEIVAVSGIKDITIGETICCPTNVEPLPFVAIDEPVLSMTLRLIKAPSPAKKATT